MKNSFANIWVVAIVVATLQATFLIWMVWDRVSLVRNGTEIVLNTEPIDPRSLFRGDYVILNYTDASRLKSPLLSVKPEPDTPLCVIFEKAQGGEVWKPVAAAKSCPEKSGNSQVAIVGKVKRSRLDTARRSSGDEKDKITAIVTYGIESYFVPEDTGKVLEQKIAKGALQVLVAVDQSGRAAIKGLIMDGKRLYDEPLW